MQIANTTDETIWRIGNSSFEVHKIPQPRAAIFKNKPVAGVQSVEILDKANLGFAKMVDCEMSHTSTQFAPLEYQLPARSRSARWPSQSRLWR